MVKSHTEEESAVVSRAGGPQLRPGGRATKVVAAIRQAVFELLAERGYDDIEIPEIASRAGVNRTTVYRRWPSKAELVLQIMLDEMRAKVPTPDTGTFQGDLEDVLRSIVRVLADPAVRSLFHVLATNPDIVADNAKARSAFWARRFSVSGEIVLRAVKRGELPNGVSSRAVLELGAAPLYYRILALGESVDDPTISELAAWVARQDLVNFPTAASSLS